MKWTCWICKQKYDIESLTRRCDPCKKKDGYLSDDEFSLHLEIASKYESRRNVPPQAGTQESGEVTMPDKPKLMTKRQLEDYFGLMGSSDIEKSMHATLEKAMGLLGEICECHVEWAGSSACPNAHRFVRCDRCNRIDIFLSHYHASEPTEQ